MKIGYHFSDHGQQFTAITWIKEFVQLFGGTMLTFASGIFTAILPCLAYDTDSMKSECKTINAEAYF